MTFLIQQTLLYAVPLMIVALAGVFAERSGIINLALEGIMIFGAFIGVLFVRYMQNFEVFTLAVKEGNWLTLQGLELLAMLAAAAMGALFSLLLSFAACDNTDPNTAGNQSSTGAIAPGQKITFEELTVVDNDLCTIKITGIEPDSLFGYTLNIYLENKSADKTFMFSASSAAINGVMTTPLFASSVAPGKKANEKTKKIIYLS